jgi:hypothetical protein
MQPTVWKNSGSNPSPPLRAKSALLTGTIRIKRVKKPRIRAAAQ